MRVKRCWLCSPVKAAPAGEPRQGSAPEPGRPLPPCGGWVRTGRPNGCRPHNCTLRPSGLSWRKRGKGGFLCGVKESPGKHPSPARRAEPRVGNTRKGGHTGYCSWPSRSSGRVPRSCQPPPPCPCDREGTRGRSGEKGGSCGCCPAQGPSLAPHCLELVYVPNR